MFGYILQNANVLDFLHPDDCRQPSCQDRFSHLGDLLPVFGNGRQRRAGRVRITDVEQVLDIPGHDRILPFRQCHRGRIYPIRSSNFRQCDRFDLVISKRVRQRPGQVRDQIAI